MKKFVFFAALFFSLVFSLDSNAQINSDRISFELGFGSALNVPTPLHIHMNGQEDIDIDSAEYDDKPLYDAPYYNWRVGLWKENKAWEIELIHHKLYLMNPTPEIDYFNISHGYNLVTLNRAWDAKGAIWRLGGGFVLAHPESRIYGKELDWSNDYLDGFYAAGPTMQATAGKRWYGWGDTFVALEAKFTASYAEVPVFDGKAYVPNLAFHAIFMIGFDWVNKKAEVGTSSYYGKDPYPAVIDPLYLARSSSI